MQVLFCTDGIFPEAVGGMQRHARLLIEKLAENFDLELIVVHPHEKELFSNYENVKEERVENINLSKNYFKQLREYSKRVYSVIEKYPKAVIYSEGLTVWYGAKNVTNRLIVNPHGVESFHATSAKEKLVGIPFRMASRNIFKNAKYVISSGGHLTDILKKNCKENKILTIPNAVNIPEQKEGVKNTNKIEFLFVARFASNKGIHVLMEAIDQLNSVGFEKKIFFHLCGKGPLYNEYTENHQKSNVKYWGFVSDEDLANLYRTVDVFCFPTLFEGMPTVVLEAMSHKLPVIVSDTGATNTMVDASNGFLIERNNVKQLVDSISNFCNLNSGERLEMSKNSFNKIEKEYNWDVVAKTHFDLFKSMV